MEDIYVTLTEAAELEGLKYWNDFEDQSRSGPI